MRRGGGLTCEDLSLNVCSGEFSLVVWTGLPERGVRACVSMLLPEFGWVQLHASPQVPIYECVCQPALRDGMAHRIGRP